MAQYVKNLKKYGNFGWRWEYNTTFDMDMFDQSWVKYRTNECGEGLWVENDDSTSGWKQIYGTCQFSLPESYSGARKKIIRELIYY